MNAADFYAFRCSCFWQYGEWNSISPSHHHSLIQILDSFFRASSSILYQKVWAVIIGNISISTRQKSTLDNMCDRSARNSLSLGYENESEGGGISPSNSNQSDDSPQREFDIENN